MRRCLLCDQILQHEPTFGQLFAKTQPDFCLSCWQGFECIQREERCQRCCGLVKKTESICEQCRYWEKQYGWIPEHHALFAYNEGAKQVLHQIKFLGDIALIDGFVEPTNEYFRKNMNKKLITGIPSATERLKVRKIDVIKHFCDQLDYAFDSFLVKLLHTPHQSEQSKTERLKLVYPFQVCQTVPKKLLLIDDVYTTGATLYQAIHALEQAGMAKNKIQTFSLFR
ncbi:MAG: ComF family protein [Culicoidibacterales bacterium]